MTRFAQLPRYGASARTVVLLVAGVVVSGCGAPPTRIEVTNGCDEVLWVAIHADLPSRGEAFDGPVSQIFILEPGEIGVVNELTHFSDQLLTWTTSVDFSGMTYDRTGRIELSELADVQDKPQTRSLLLAGEACP